MFKVDLNSDLGESFGSYKIGLDEAVIRHVTSANIACGWHAGDPLVMDKTIEMAVKSGTEVGAHPGFMDLMGFGRRNMSVTPMELKAYVKYQLGAIMAFCTARGIKLQHLKPHGSMYNMAAVDAELSMAIAEAICEVDSSIVLLGLANSEMIRAGRRAGLKAASEVFADRAYNSDGTLVSRKQEGSLIRDVSLAAKRVVRMVKEGKVIAITGEEIDIEAHSICVHGDNPEAIEFVKAIRASLEKEGIEITSIKNILG